MEFILLLFGFFCLLITAGYLFSEDPLAFALKAIVGIAALLFVAFVSWLVLSIAMPHPNQTPPQIDTYKAYDY